MGESKDETSRELIEDIVPQETEAPAEVEEVTVSTESEPFPFGASVEEETPVVVAPREVSYQQTEEDADAASPRRFLAAYVTSILAAVSLLGSGAYLGYVLLDYFLSPKEDRWIDQYFDMAPVHISVMTSVLVFGLLYLVASQYVAKHAARNDVGLRDWRVYRVVYSSFSAVLLTVAASVAASLLYIPVAAMFIADDMTSSQVMVQVFGGLNVLLWVGVLIWQERLVKNGKHSALQGVVTVILALLLVVLVGIFPVGGQTDKRFDKRAVNDLNAIETAINDYKKDHDENLPKDLASLKFESSSTISKRLANYKYTVKKTDTKSTSSSAKQDAYRQMMGISADDASMSMDDSELSLDDYLLQLDKKTAQKYTLCTTFRTDTQAAEDSPIDALMSSYSGGAKASFSKHTKGEVCFDRS